MALDTLAQVTPDLVGIPAADKPFDTLADDAVFLSTAAKTWLHSQPGATLPVTVGAQAIALRVAGSLLHAHTGQRIGVMDIGAAQWRSDIRAKDWVGNPVGEALGYDLHDPDARKIVQRIISSCIARGSLRSVRGKTVQRKDAIFVEMT